MIRVTFAVLALLGSFYVLWWGYKNLLRREREPGGGPAEGQLCTLCRRPFPINELVIREKMAGFENYFCGECIEGLMHDWAMKSAKAGAQSAENGTRA